MQKRTGLLIISLVALLLFGTCIFFFRNLLFGGVVATYEEASKDQSEYSQKWVSYEVIACLGEYAEYTETQYFIPTEHKYYYMCWMEDGAIMPIVVSSKKDREYLDSMTDATYDYLDEITDYIEMEPKTFIGTVENQSSEATKYYKDYLNGISASESDGFDINYVVLDCSGSRVGYFLLCGGVMMIPILGLVVCFVGYRKDKKKEANETETYLPK